MSNLYFILKFDKNGPNFFGQLDINRKAYSIKFYVCELFFVEFYTKRMKIMAINASLQIPKILCKNL